MAVQTPKEVKLDEALDIINENKETSLILKDNDLFVGEVKKLATALFSNTALTSFRLTCAELPHNDVGDEGMEYIAKSLANNTALVSLQVDHCNLSAEGGKHVAELLKSNTTLTSFNINDNNIEAEGLRHICESLTNNPQLKSLCVAGNEIGATGAKQLAALLKTNRLVTNLDCSANDIGDEGLAALCHVMKQNNTLVTLNISDNNIEGEGIRTLAEMLQFNTRLSTLICTGNLVGDGGADMMATSLRENKTLQKLHLSQKIDDAGAIALAHMLNINTSLQELDLRPCLVGADGAKALMNALKTNKDVIALNIYQPDDNKEVQLLINKLCNRNINNKKVKKEKTRITPQHLGNRLDWTPELVGVWLGKQGYENQAHTFERYQIDGHKLMTLTLDSLRAIGVEPYAIRRDLLDSIDRLRENVERLLRTEWDEVDDNDFDAGRVHFSIEDEVPPQLSHMQQMTLEREKNKRSTPLPKVKAEAEQLEEDERLAEIEAKEAAALSATSPKKKRPVQRKRLVGNYHHLPLSDELKAITPASLMPPQTPTKSDASGLSPTKSATPGSPSHNSSVLSVSQLSLRTDDSYPDKAFYNSALAGQRARERKVFQGSKEYEQSIAPLPQRYT
eukprot:TRINITY_DN67773_c0_g1_i12.p1 TRINITY_DN67773_c0_g1~~TRINITY_DN67773_c0_g1_i12.p1  ORF type:complete len:621 (+),score=76.14 TRINITY_DN67773_c0_g1_i12:60-1922(+)